MFRNVLKACTLLKAVEHRLHPYLLQPKWSKLLESGRNVINFTSKFSSPLKTLWAVESNILRRSMIIKNQKRHGIW